MRPLICLLLLLFTGLKNTPVIAEKQGTAFSERATKLLKSKIIEDAAWALLQQPVTVTAHFSSRSQGTRNDFFSEGDYWWPDPQKPEGPYIQRDGMTNPDNFVAHRKSMIRFSRIIGALASAYKITGDEKYVKHAVLHCKAWFIDLRTKMNPNLQYAQAIKGRFTGRGIGIIDTIQLMEVAQGLLIMKNSKTLDEKTLNDFKIWFDEYLVWLTTHQYGRDEMNAENNHGTCWVMQVASFAKLTGNKKLLNFCIERYKNVLLPNQMLPDGSFPRELKRTKPYGYSIFNLDAMTMICQILSDDKNDLWIYKADNGATMKQGLNFLYPYLRNKSSWPFQQDVMYWNNWPVAQPSLLFGAMKFNEEAWYKTWEQLDHAPKEEEVIRNLPIRNPIIWFN